MTLENFEQTQVATRAGSVRLWLTPGAAGTAPETRRPVAVAIPGILSAEGDMARLVSGLGLLADGAMIRPPQDFGPGAADLPLAEVSELVGEVIERAFAGRQVVLFGASSGAVIALGVHAANVARVVAVEPPLTAGGLWPIEEQLAGHLRQTPSPLVRGFVGAAFGIGPGEIETRDHTGVLDGLTVPVDVVLASEPLAPKRAVSRFPSLVCAEDRLRLSRTPGVRLHLAPGTGHNVVGQAIQKVLAILQEACRRANLALPPERLRLDEPLLEATPLAARRVAYAGDQGEVFAEAFHRRNPTCEVVLAEGGAPPEGLFEAVVLGAPVSPDRLARFAELLEPGGHLVARWRTPDAALGEELAAAGLALREPVDAGGTGVVRAQKLAPGAVPRPALFLHSIAYASLLMDIRTRLPTTGLASDPELRVVYDLPPFQMPPMDRDAPKVLLLQRPLEARPEVWRDFQAGCIRDGWLVVLEFDDYPPLIAEVKGKAYDPQTMQAFGYMHAVQTASPRLAELFRPFNPEIALFPNAVFDLAPFPQGPAPRRVFYGGVLRGRYAVEVARSLEPAFRGFDDVEVVVIGDREVFDTLPAPNKRYYEYMGYEAYLDLMAQCAVSLSPIEALPFRDTKSDAKFLDASRAGVLTIASPTIYDRVIRHGENGLLARDVADWAPLLRQALTDEPMRARLARAAWEEVRRDRMFANQVAQRRDWYWDLWRRREALNEALMARTPGLRELVAAQARR